MNATQVSEKMATAMGTIARIDVPEALVKAVENGMGIQANRVYEVAARSSACGLFGVDVLLAVRDEAEEQDSSPDCLGMLEAYKHGFAIAAAMLVDTGFVDDVDVLLEALSLEPKELIKEN